MRLTQVLLVAVMAAAPWANAQSCPRPPVDPVLEIGDWIYDVDNPPQPGEAAGDSICELYCAIRVRDSSVHIPQCSLYECTFQLVFPDGKSLDRSITFGQWADGMSEPRETGTVCSSWSDLYPAGWYRATLWCKEDPAAKAELRFFVEKSQATGFDIPSSLWQGQNRCPGRPAFDSMLSFPGARACQAMTR